MVSSSISLPSSGFFSPFPRGTSSLSVSKEYLALEGGPPRFKQDFSCPVLLRILACFVRFRIRDFHPLWSAFPNSSSIQLPLMQVLQPQSARTLVWASLRSLAATSRISIDLFSGRYLDVSVPYVGSSSTTLLIDGSSSLSWRGVAPFRNLRIKAWLSAPRSLSQINRVFHRLLLPRYPPHALNSFILVTSMDSFKKLLLHGSRLLAYPVMWLSKNMNLKKATLTSRKIQIQ